MNVQKLDCASLNKAADCVKSQFAEEMLVEADSDATLLVLSGEPLNEPIVGSGPFVMNSEKELSDAFNDFNSDRFWQIPPVTT